MAQSPSGSTMWGALTDLANNRWRLQWGGASVGIQCVRNDVVDTNTSNVARAWVSPSGYFCQENIYGGSWYYDPKLAAANKFAWVLISAPTSAPPVQQPPATTPVSTPTAGGGPGARSDFITADLALAQNYKNRNAQQIVDRKMWGVSTGGAGNNSFACFGNDRFLSQAAILNPGLWRFNGDLPQRGDTPYFNGDMSVNQNTFSRLVSNFYKVDPLGISGVVLGVNLAACGNNLSNYAKAMRNLADFLNNARMGNGSRFPLVGMFSQNEPDNMSVDAIQPSYDAMWDQVKAVNPNILMTGPVTSWAANFMPNWQQRVRGLDVYDYHVYAGGYTDDINNPGLPKPRWTGAIGKATADFNAINGTLNTTNVKAILTSEYNCDWNCRDPAQHTYEGATWAAAYLVTCLDMAPLPYWATVWDAQSDGTCGVLDDNMNLNPLAYLISQAVRAIFGPRWQVTVNRKGYLICACTPAPGRAAMMIVNPGKGADSGPIAFSHIPGIQSGNGTANIWQLTSAQNGLNQDGAKFSAQMTAGIVPNVNIPDPSVTLVTVSG
jgi:hypothetical protein